MNQIQKKSVELLKAIIKKVGRKKVNRAILKNPKNPHRALMSLFSILLIIIMIGCASSGINLDTPEKKYLGARAELNLLLEQYIQIQDKVSDNDHANAKRAFLAADMALDTWELMLGGSNYDFSNDIRIWLEAKNTILEIIRRVTK